MRMDKERLLRNILSLEYERRGKGGPRERWLQKGQLERGWNYNEGVEKEIWRDN